MASASTTILPALSLLIILAFSHVQAATPPPPPPAPLPPGAAATEFLAAHNAARAAVRVAPLTWSQTLAAAASRMARLQRDTARCQFANLSSSSRYGANQMWASGGGGVPPPRAVVDSWVAEKQYYEHRSNTCAPGGHMCGVYTQVVWRKSVQLGCGSATCTKDGKDEESSLTICFYDPPGNYVGESPY